MVCVSQWILSALSKSFSKDVVSHHSLSKACVPWKWIIELNVLLSILHCDFVVCPFVCLVLHCLFETLISWWFELIDLWSSGLFKMWLRYQNFYFFDFDLFVGDANNVGGSSTQHFWWGDVCGCLCSHIFVFGLQILPFDIVAVVHIIGDFPKCGCVNILWLNWVYIASISYTKIMVTWNMWCSLFFLNHHSIIVHFLGDVPKSLKMYPVYPGTMY